MYTTLDLTSAHSSLWTLSLAGPARSSPFLQGSYDEGNGRFSPDSHWVAYASDESGRWEIYTQSFPVPGQKVQISTSGGTQPEWRGDGKELFYIAPDNKMMSVEIKAGATIEASTPRILFQTEIAPLVEARNQYVVTKDGQRFLINTPVKDISTAPIAVLVNPNLGSKNSTEE